MAVPPQEVGRGEDEEAVLGRHRLGLVGRRGRLPLVGELLLLVVLLLAWHLQPNNIKGVPQERRESQPSVNLKVRLVNTGYWAILSCRLWVKYLVAVFGIPLPWALVILTLVVVVDCNLGRKFIF